MITKVNNMIDSIFKCGNNEIQLCEDPIELHRDIQRRQDNLTRDPVLYPDSHHAVKRVQILFIDHCNYYIQIFSNCLLI